MANLFRIYRVVGSEDRVYALFPWDTEITMAEEFLDQAKPPMVRRHGDRVDIVCANGSATYQLLRQHEVDLERRVHRCRVIESIWSPPD